MMIRIALIIAILGCLSLTATWLAGNPGNVSITWLGYEIETSFAFLIFAITTAVVTGLIIYHLLFALLRTPKNISRNRAMRHQQEGLRVLTEAIAAITVSEYDMAQRLTRRAEKLLDAPPITLLLSAQLSQLKGDDGKAKEYLEEMLKNPETEYLAMRGLIENARRHNDYFLALAHAERAYASRPGNKWVLMTLIDLYSYLGRWQEAQMTVERSLKKRHFTRDEARRYSAIIHFEQGKRLLKEGDENSALQFFAQAHAKYVGFIPVALTYATLKADYASKEEAAKIIRETWRMAPHPALAEKYISLFSSEKEDQFIKRVEKLVKFNPSHKESRLAVAAGAIQASRWQQAREQLALVLSEEENARACKLMAEIEQKESGNVTNAAQWLIRATNAAPEPGWSCSNCGHISQQWDIHCDSCGSFDTISWKITTFPYLGKSERSELTLVSA